MPTFFARNRNKKSLNTPSPTYFGDQAKARFPTTFLSMSFFLPFVQRGEEEKKKQGTCFVFPGVVLKIKSTFDPNFMVCGGFSFDFECDQGG